MLRSRRAVFAHEPQSFFSPSPSDGVAEEVGHRQGRAGRYGLLKDEIAHRNIEDAEPEGREDARLAGVQLKLPVQNIHQSTGDEVSASARRLRQMQ